MIAGDALRSGRAGHSRRVADDGRRRADPAVRFPGIFVGVVNAAPVVISASRDDTGKDVQISGAAAGGPLRALPSSGDRGATGYHAVSGEPVVPPLRAALHVDVHLLCPTREPGLDLADIS